MTHSQKTRFSASTCQGGGVGGGAGTDEPILLAPLQVSAPGAEPQ